MSRHCICSRTGPGQCGVLEALPWLARCTACRGGFCLFQTPVFASFSDLPAAARGRLLRRRVVRAQRNRRCARGPGHGPRSHCGHLPLRHRPALLHPPLQPHVAGGQKPPRRDSGEVQTFTHRMNEQSGASLQLMTVSDAADNSQPNFNFLLCNRVWGGRVPISRPVVIVSNQGRN